MPELSESNLLHRAQWIDVRNEPHDDVLGRVEQVFGVKLHRSSVVHGTNPATEGFSTSRETWVQLKRRPLSTPVSRDQEWAWLGAESAAMMIGVAKPAWFRSYSWVDHHRDVVWRADEMELVASPVFSVPNDCSIPPKPTEQWWSVLKTSLTELGKYETERFGMTQQHLTLRVNQVFPGQVDTTVDDWTTGHADLHWANLTQDGHLLDWESWGRVPRGLDAATLWGFSLPYNGLPQRVLTEFADDFATRSGTIARLVVCCNIIRAAKSAGKNTPYLIPATAAVQDLLSELK